MMDGMTSPEANDLSQLFRVASRLERRLGLWVDRIGEKVDQGYPVRHRVLGLYGAVYICEGAGRFESQSAGVHEVHAGQCLLLFPREPHRYGSLHGPWHTRWVVWGGERAEAFERLGYLDTSRPVVTDSAGAATGACRELLPLMGAADPGACLQRSIVVGSLVLRLYRQRACSDRTPAARDTVRLVVEYLDEHYREAVRPEQLARRFTLSYTHLRRLFRQAVGQSMKEYIICKRISHAKALLHDGVRPIKRVAAAVGYDDEYYFMRLFRRHTGVSAGQFE